MYRLILLLYLILSTISTHTLERDNSFKTDFTKSSIDLKKVLNGGPGKDGIPAINNPQFVSIDDTYLDNNTLGLLIKIDGVTKFYPYNILVWHEIVNDSINDTYFTVTYCPLCGSAIAFNREFNGKIHRFGVSGYLYESNLLMYDNITESFWSQSLGNAVIGHYTGVELEILNISLMEIKDVVEKYPDVKILSEDTGYNRNYSLYPYGDYEISNTLFFPVSVKNHQYHVKELMYVFIYDGISFSFPMKKVPFGEYTYKYNNHDIDIHTKGGEIEIKVDGELLPGYYEMWFSWIVHNGSSGITIDLSK